MTVEHRETRMDNLGITDFLRSLAENVFGNKGRPTIQISEPGVLAGEGGVRRKLVTDAVTYLLSKIVPGLMGFISVVVFVRLIGYEQYGRYAVVFAIVMAAASGMAGWLAQGILRFQSQMSGPFETDSFWHSSVTGTVLSVGLGGCVLALVISFSGVQRGWPLVASVALFGVLLTYTVALAHFQASLRSGQVFRFEIVRSVGGFAIPVVAMLVTGSRAYWLLLVGIGLGYSLPLLAPVISHSRRVAHSRGVAVGYLSAQERAILGKLWRFGWPVALWFLCQQCLLVSDRFFLQRFVGYSEAGVYSSIYDVVVRSFSLLFMPVTLAVHPLVMNRWNSGNAKSAFAAIRSGVKYQVLMFLPIALAFGVFAHPISRIVLGKQVPDAATIVLPLALSGFLWQTCLLIHKPLEILCLTKRMLSGMVAALAVNVAGNWLLIPRLGYRAAAYLSVASSATYLLLVFILTPMQELRRAVASDGPASAIKADPTPADGCLTTSP